jgi:CheY-like chemotaxis protein
MPTSPSPDGRPLHILAINNDPDILSLFRDLLEDEGYRVTTQSYLDHDLAGIAAMQPDLVVLDYMWSYEDNSWALPQLLRMHPKTARIPILLCTAAVQEVQLLEGHLASLGIQVVLKPFHIEQLITAIGQALAQRGAESPSTLAAEGDSAHGRTAERIQP